MRIIKRLIILIFIIIVGLPLAIVGASLIKDATPPSYIEEFEVEDVNVEEEIKNEIDKFLMQFLMGDQKVIIHEQKVNRLIYSAYSNKDIDAEIDLKNIWIDFEDDKLTTYALVGYKNVSTTLTLTINVEGNNHNTKISLNTMKIGKLPIPKALFTFILDNFANDLDTDYSFGESNFEDLSFTIYGTYIQQQLEKQLDNDFIIFDYFKFEGNNFMVYCKLNTENAQGLVFQNTINELKDIIQDDDKLMNKIVGDEGVLDENDPTEQALSEDFLALQDKISNPDTLTEEDLEIVESIQENYQNLTPDKQEEIAEIIENSISDEIKDDFLQALEELDITGIDNISDLILGD